MEEKILAIMKNHFPTQTNEWLLSTIKQMGKSYVQWKTFSEGYLVEPEPFFNEIAQLLGLKEQKVSPVISVFDLIVQSRISLERIQLYSKIQQRIKNSLLTSPDINKYLQREISYIIDLLQTEGSLEKYFQSILNQSKTIDNPLSHLFQEMKYADFLVLLKKSAGSNNQFTYLLSLQNPVSITSSSKNIKQCLSFLKCENYSLITNIGTKGALQQDRLFLVHDIFNLNDQSTKNTVFSGNVNLFRVNHDQTIILADFMAPQNQIQPKSLFSKILEKTSLLILHTTMNDLQQIIKLPPKVFQTIQKLVIFVWDQKEITYQSSQLLQLFNKDSPLRKSTDGGKNLTEYLILVQIHPNQPSLVSNTEEIKNLLKAPLENKNFNIHPEFYLTKVDQIDKFLENSSTKSIQHLLPYTYKQNKGVAAGSHKVSPFINQCIKYLKEQNYCQFLLFAEKLSKFKARPLSLDNIIYQISIYNELTIDRKLQVLRSAAQQIISNYYLRCLNNFLPFIIIDQNIDQFGNQSLQRFWQQINSQFQKDTFIVSVIGADSKQKTQLINGLFRYNFYMRECHLGRGLYMSLCRISINNVIKNVVVFNTSKIINQQVSKFDLQIITYLFNISNLVLITNFEKSSQRLTDSLKISSLIRKNILLNSKKDQIPPKIFVVCQSLEESLKQQLNSLYQIQKDDFFTIQTKSKNSYILNLRKRIFDYLGSRQRVSGNFYELYKKQKVSWQLLDNISQQLFQSKTQNQVNQNAKLIADYLSFYKQKKQQLIAKIKQEINAHTKQLTNEGVKAQQVQKIIKQLDIFKEKTFSNIYIQKITRLYNNINQYLKNDAKQNQSRKQLEELQPSIDSTLLKDFKQNLTNNLEKSIQTNRQKITLLLKQQKQRKVSLEQNLIKSNLQTTFQIILESEPIFEGVLSINNINACIAFYNQFIDSFSLSTIINNLEYFVEIQNSSSLKYQNKVEINSLINKQLDLLKGYFKTTYLPGLATEVQILQTFSQIMKKITQSVGNLVDNLKNLSQKIQKRLSLVQINFKKYVIGTIYTTTIEYLLAKKEDQSFKRLKKIEAILKAFEQKSQILLEMRNYLQKQDYLIFKQKSLDHYKDQIFKLIIQRNIVQSCLKETIENDKNGPGEPIDQLKELYIECFKIIKNPQRYFNQKIITQSDAILKTTKNQLESAVFQQIFSLFEDTTKSYEKFYKEQYSNFQDISSQQINSRVLQKQIALVWDKLLHFIQDKLTESICQQKCPHCKAQCILNSKHDSHSIRHYLIAYGGPEVTTNTFDLNFCTAAIVIPSNQYKNNLLTIWANIEDAFILTTYTQAKKSDSIKSKKQIFLTFEDLDQERKGLSGSYQLRNY